MSIAPLVSFDGPSEPTPVPEPPLRATVKTGRIPSLTANASASCSCHVSRLPAKSSTSRPSAIATVGVASDSQLFAEFEEDQLAVYVDIHDLDRGLFIVLQRECAGVNQLAIDGVVEHDHHSRAVSNWNVIVVKTVEASHRGIRVDGWVDLVDVDDVA